MEVIGTREALADALTTAAELEHNLLLEYLFAAFSLKNAHADDITWHQAEKCRQWERTILAVARDEMTHLGMVCNLLSAIGEAPQFRRRNFPQRPTISSPFDYELAPFSDETLYRFMRAEQPGGRHPKPPYRRNAPRTMSAAFRQRSPLFYKHTGDLYRAIAAGFATIGDLFIGPTADQDTSGWSNNFSMTSVTGPASAKRAIASILHQGEGSPRHREGSHYDQFEDIREEYAAEGYFAAALPIASNPRVDDTLPDAPPGSLITNPLAKDVAGLFNAVYEIALLMLMQYYSYGGESPGQRVALREAIRTSMSMVIRPIAEVLTRLPLGGRDGLNAGPSFEISHELRISNRADNRWKILAERFAANAKLAAALAARDPKRAGRLAFVGENVALIANNVATAAAS